MVHVTGKYVKILLMEDTYFYDKLINYQVKVYNSVQMMLRDDGCGIQPKKGSHRAPKTQHVDSQIISVTRIPFVSTMGLNNNGMMWTVMNGIITCARKTSFEIFGVTFSFFIHSLFLAITFDKYR